MSVMRGRWWFGRAIAALPCLGLLPVIGSRAATTLHAQAELKGKVLTDSTRAPVSDVEIVLTQVDRTARTDRSGKFRLTDLPAGMTRVLIRRIGYRSLAYEVELRAREVVDLEITMRAGPTQLEPILVTAPPPPARISRLEDFERRRSNSSGQFLTADLLRQNDGKRLGDVVRHLRGVRVVPRRAQGSFGQALVSQFTGCYLRVWVDGIMLNNETQIYDLDQMPVANLAGVELYVGFQETPVEFEAPGLHCGALVLWTRDR